MENKIVILGRVPSKKNSKIMICRGKFPQLLPSKNYTEWHKDAMEQLVNQKNTLINKDEITLTFYSPDKRPADLSNKTESIMDLLVDAKFIEDDNWFVIKKLTLVFGGVDKESPRVEIV